MFFCDISHFLYCTRLLCNRCYIHSRDSKSAFSLTQCGHLFCSKCILKAANQCPVCKTNGVQTMRLTTPLQPIIRPMFEDIQTMAEQLLLAFKFQKTQLSMLEHREQELAKKYMALKTGYWQLVEQNKKLVDKYNALKTDYNDLIAQKNSCLQSIFKPPRSTPRVCFSQQNTIFGSNQPDSHKMFHPVSSNNSEESDGSSSTIRESGTAKTPDSLFRVPTATRIPRSVGSSSSRSESSTPMSVEYDNKSTGYGSDVDDYFRQ